MKRHRSYILLCGLLLLIAFQGFSLFKHYQREKGIIINDIRNALFLADYSEISHRLEYNIKKDTCIQGAIDSSVGIMSDGKVSHKTTIKFQDITKPSIIFKSDTPQPVKFKSIDEYQTFNSISFIGLHTAVDYLEPININLVDSLFRVKLKHENIYATYRLSVVLLDRDVTPIDSVWGNPLYFFTKELPVIKERYYDLGDTTIQTFANPLMKRYAPMWISVNGDAYLYNYELSGRFAYLVEIKNINLIALGRISHIITFSVVSTLIIIILLVILIYKNNKLIEMKEREKHMMQDMTHELKTPIAVSLAAIEAIADEEYPPTDEKRIEYLNIIRSKLSQLNNQITKILSPHKKAIIKSSTNLRDAIQDVLNESRLRISPNGFISVHIPYDISVPIPKEDISRIFANMLDNAIKYTSDIHRIDINAVVNEGIAIIRIADNGVGIGANDLPHIFERNYRGSNLLAGFGLGLADVRDTLLKYDSSIVVAETSPKGTTFEMKIKL